MNGVLTNAKGGANLVTDAVFTDFKLHVEVRYPPKGNSGVYLRGRHEMQVEDSVVTNADAEATGGLGAIYGFLIPNQNASNGAGKWETLDVTLYKKVDFSKNKVIEKSRGVRVSGFLVRGFPGFGVFAFGATHFVFAHNSAIADGAYGLAAFNSHYGQILYNYASSPGEADIYVGATDEQWRRQQSFDPLGEFVRLREFTASRS